MPITEHDSYKLSRFLISSDPLTNPVTESQYRLLYSTRSNSVFIANESTWKQLYSGHIDRLPEDFIRQLYDRKIITDEGENELDSILQENEDSVLNMEELYEVIQPTALCQMGCHYCGQTHSNRLLSQDDQEAVLKRIRNKLQAGSYRSLRIGWFGSEPLAGLAVIRTLSPKLIQLAAEFGCTYGAKIVTNGLSLNKDTALELEKSHKVDSVEITLDGTEEFHDRRRILKTGKSTFKKIFDNLLSIASSAEISFRIIIRCNVDQDNIEGVSPLIELLAEHNLQRRLSFYPVSVYSWGNDAHLKSIPPESYGQQELAWFRQMTELGFEIGLMPQRRPIVCMAVHKDSELIDAYGNVFNCTEVSYVPAYGEPNKYSIGTVSTPAASASRPFEDFNKKVRSGEFQCYQCPMLPVCGGGCPKQWGEGLVPCPSAKFNIKGRLKMLFEAL